MVEPTCELFQHWRATGQSVQHVRLDNAGENKRLQQRSESADWKLGIHYEFTDARTPQRNCLAEVAFQTILCQGRAMMAHANMPMDIRYRVFQECMITATLLDGLTVIELGGITATRYVHWCGSNPQWSKHLRVFGEAGTFKTATRTTPKIANWGEQCIFLGYATDHAPDCYRMWNPITGDVLIARDVTWLHRMYYANSAGVQEDIAITPDCFEFIGNKENPVVAENAGNIEEDQDALAENLNEVGESINQRRRQPVSTRYG